MAAPVKIIILGGGTSGWMCAAALSELIRTGRYSVRLVESDEIGTVGVGEATLPHIKAFNDSLGIDEAEFMRRTQATFKLGIEFVDWGKAGNRYIHPFGAFGQNWAGIDFHHHWLRARQAGVEVAPLEAYSFAIAAARAGKFEFPGTDARSVKSTYAYAYHFDAGLYAGFMRDFATARGIMRTEGRVQDVQHDPESGDIRRLVLQSGETIDGDLFVDCSGFVALMIDKALHAGWEDWSQWLPCDRAWAVPTARAEPFTPYTRSTAREAGWQWRIPLQHRTGNGYVFAGAFTTEDKARETLLANLDGPPLAEPKLLRFKAGRRTHSWTKNCIAIGLSSGFLEPLESTSIYLVQAAVAQLLKLIAARDDPRARAEFNRAVDVEYDRVRDFLILHYYANTQTDGELWQHTRTMPIPDSLAQKIELFRHRGAIATYRDGLFSPPSWLSVYYGQDVHPQGYDRAADGLPLDMVTEKLDELHKRIASQVDAMATHAAAVRSYCAEPVQPVAAGGAQ